jgi:hypothetical protein
MGRRYAYRQMEAAEVCGQLATPVGPSNEAQARELVPLKDDPDTVVAVSRETHTSI